MSAKRLPKLLAFGIAATLIAACSAGSSDEEASVADAAPPAGTVPVLWMLDVDHAGVAAKVDEQMAAITAGQRPDFLTVSEIAETYGATDADSAAVLDFLSNAGVDAKLDSTASFVETAMSVAQIDALLGVQFALYSGHGPYDLPTVPAELTTTVTNVIIGNDGPEPFADPSPKEFVPTPSPTPPPPASAGPSGGPRIGCSTAIDGGAYFFPNQLNTAYGVSSIQDRYRGEGVRIGMMESGTSRSSFEAFAQCMDVDVDLYDHPYQLSEATGEGTMDPQAATWAAPELGGLDFWSLGQLEYGGSGYQDEAWWQIWVGRMSKVIDPAANGGTAPLVISESIEPDLACPGPHQTVFAPILLKAMSEAVNRAAATGATLLFASGDAGSYDDVRHYCAPWPNILAPITIVGGTHLELTADNAIAGPGGQSAWNGSGGGIVADVPQPAYQSGIFATNTTNRLAPDVAFGASGDPGFALQGTVPYWGPASGTSFSTPYAAGGVALLVQAAGEAIGPLNPYLYKAATQNGGADYDKYFYDVVDGNNKSTPDATCCDAGPGFDLATGLGSIKFDAFVGFIIAETQAWGSPQ